MEEEDFDAARRRELEFGDEAIIAAAAAAAAAKTTTTISPDNVSFDTSLSEASSSSVSKNELGNAAEDKRHDNDDEESQLLRERYLQLLRFIVKSEEVRNKSRMFHKVYEADDDNKVIEEDWSANHYLAGSDSTECRVILTSYEYLPLRKNFPQELSTSSIVTGTWMIIPCAPEKPKHDNGVEEYFHWQNKRKNRQFANVDEMLQCLTLQDVNEIPSGKDVRTDNLRKSLRAAVEYYAYKPLQAAYEHLFKSLAYEETDAQEMLLGFGHVRALLSTAKNKSTFEKRIVNGPLFEVPVEVQLDEQNHIHVKPTAHAEIELNEEVLSAVMSTGKCNHKLIKKLHELAKKTKISSDVDPFDSSNFENFLQTACKLQCGAKIRSLADANVNDPPENLENLLITDALCLYSRKKKNCIFAADARRLLESVKNGRLVTEPVRGLLSGPEYVQKPCVAKEIAQEDSLVYCLPSSDRQKQIGTRLLVKGEPIVTVVGPPGTGKTHSIVNIAATALSQNKSVVVTSSNPRALQAFMDKLPASLRDLALDMSSVKNQDITQVQLALEKMTKALMESDTEATDVMRLEEHIMKKKASLNDIIQHLQDMSAISHDLLADEASRLTVQSVSEISPRAPWLVTALFSRRIENFSIIVDTLRGFDKAFSFGRNSDLCFTEGWLQDIKQRVQRQIEKNDDKNNDESFRYFSFEDAPSVADENVGLIKIGNSIPAGKSDWEAVSKALEFIEKCFLPSLECGASKEELIEEVDELSFHVRPALIDLLQKCCELENLVGQLEEKHKNALGKLFQASMSNYRVQEQHQQLASEIQVLESELVFGKVIVSLKEKLDKSQLSKLKQLCQRLSKMKQGHLASRNVSSERGSRYLEDFASLFKDAAEFMPFLVVTLKQASQFLGPDHTCDIGIVDEASQSSCSAVNFMARCKQMLVVGDDKQVSPSVNGISEESIRCLKQNLPGIATDEQLLPEYSFFDLTQASFPLSEVFLYEHYRSLPDIIQISNTLWYHDALVPLRIGGKPDIISCVYVNGERKPNSKVNEIEAEKIANDVYQEIERTSKRSDYQTIAVISMGGPEQAKRIKQLVEEKTNDLMDEYGSEVVDRHRILYGTSDECQGHERDIVFVSTVSSPAAPVSTRKRAAKSKNKKKTNKTSAEVPEPESEPETTAKKNVEKRKKLPQDDRWKEWNVALTRAKNRIVLYRSIDFRDLDPKDVRSRIFRFFPKKGQTICNAKVDSNCEIAFALDRHQVVVNASDALSKKLFEHGYLVRRKGGQIWNEAVCVELASSAGGDSQSSTCVLLHLESCGESEKEWLKLFDEQLSLTRAGRFCLRINCLSLLLNFDSTFDGVLKYLAKKGLPPPRKRTTPEGCAAPGGTACTTMSNKRSRP